MLGMSMQGDTEGAGDRQGWVNLSQRGHVGKKGREEAGRSLFFVLSLLGLHTDTLFLHRQARDLALLSSLVEKVAESCCLASTSCKKQNQRTGPVPPRCSLP